MSAGSLYNNLGIEAVSIMLVLQKMKVKSISKATLILPFVAHGELLSFLSRSNTRVMGIEKLLIEKTPWFSNFNRRFYDNLCSSVNALQFLHEISLIDLKGGQVAIKSKLNFDSTMGSRAKQIDKASENIASLLDEGDEKLYLNLRIEL